VVLLPADLGLFPGRCLALAVLIRTLSPRACSSWPTTPCRLCFSPAAGTQWGTGLGLYGACPMALAGHHHPPPAATHAGIGPMTVTGPDPAWGGLRGIHFLGLSSSARDVLLLGGGGLY